MVKNKSIGIVISVIVVVLVIICLIIITKNGKKPEALEEAKDISANIMDSTQEVQDENTNKNTSVGENTQTGGVKVTILKEGSGNGVVAGDKISVNYTGTFTNGTVFDSNVDPKFGHPEPLELAIGTGMVIKGWDEGLLGMKVGEKRRLEVSPEYGYGPNDYGKIPGNSTLIFEVELLKINK